MPELSTIVAGFTLFNPVFNSSGPRCTTKEELDLLGSSESSAILTKSCTLEPREGNSEPRYAQFPGGSINSMGLPNLGYKAYMDIIPSLKVYNKPIIASVSGFSLDENITMIRELSEIDELDAIELNLSCPNIAGKPQMGYDFDQSYDVLNAVAQVCKKPLGVKLPPYFDAAHFQSMAKILNTSTVQFITSINSLGNGLVLDPEKEQTLIRPNSGMGGIGGAFAKPFGLSNVYRFRSLLNKDISVIGVGGISTGLDVFEYILAGADAVQVGTALEDEGVAIFTRIVGELRDIMKRKGYESLDEFRGKLTIV